MSAAVNISNTGKTREEYEAAWKSWALESAQLCMTADVESEEYFALKAQLKDLIQRAADRVYGSASD